MCRRRLWPCWWWLLNMSRTDHVHLTVPGCQMLGDLPVNEMMEQYKRFLAVRAD